MAVHWKMDMFSGFWWEKAVLSKMMIEIGVLLEELNETVETQQLDSEEQLCIKESTAARFSNNWTGPVLNLVSLNIYTYICLVK